MLLLKTLKQMMDYIAQGVTEIFSLNHDDYPAVGEQPYDDGEMNQNRQSYLRTTKRAKRF